MMADEEDSNNLLDRVLWSDEAKFHLKVDASIDIIVFIMQA